MLHGILTLLACQRTGEALARGLGLTVPGPVLGMARCSPLALPPFLRSAEPWNRSRRRCCGISRCCSSRRRSASCRVCRTSPLLWLTATLATYLAATQVQEWLGRHPLANPVLIAVATLVLVLHLSGTSYSVYFDGAQFVHFMLGPATVALKSVTTPIAMAIAEQAGELAGLRPCS